MIPAQRLDVPMAAQARYAAEVQKRFAEFIEACQIAHESAVAIELFDQGDGFPWYWLNRLTTVINKPTESKDP